MAEGRNLRSKSGKKEKKCPVVAEYDSETDVLDVDQPIADGINVTEGLLVMPIVNVESDTATNRTSEIVSSPESPISSIQGNMDNLQLFNFIKDMMSKMDSKISSNLNNIESKMNSNLNSMESKFTEEISKKIYEKLYKQNLIIAQGTEDRLKNFNEQITEQIEVINSKVSDLKLQIKDEIGELKAEFIG